ncbi:MAG: DUF1552 domain-containing protein [Polyangiaceae bacterium]|nr:DUF1552 domain-containing protein [Polyangiaceae bacterium]
MSRTRSFSQTNRRRFLRGALGTAMALPFLEVFAPKKASAATPPKKYAFMFGGMSIGSNSTGKIAPANAGALDASNLTPALAPLGEAGVTQEVTIVSGLEIPTGSTPPVAGRPPSFHSTSHQVLATGRRFDVENWGALPGVSSDWVAAATLSAGTSQPVLVYRSQPSFYRVGSQGTTDGIISARLNGSGNLEQVPPITSPRVAYEAMFSGFVPPDNAGADQAKRLLALRTSVVDLVATDASELSKRLGKADQIRMQRHFDELRALETRLDAMELPTGTACSMPAHPGDDPPIGDAIDPSGGGEYADNYTNANGYSNEDLRASVMTDLIHMAFACDISRVSSFMLTHAQCFMNMYTLLGLPSDLHEISHGSIGGGTQAETQAALGQCAAWHVKHFARLVQKLRDTEDTDGSPLLDNTGLVLAFEGGWGYDPAGGGDSSPHSTENMVMLVSGRAGGLNLGQHLPAAGAHPSAVLNTVLRAVGVDATLGEVSGTVDSLVG